WLRGINPRANTTPPPPLDHEEVYVQVGAPWPIGTAGPVILFGDASGGKHGTDPRRRRVGIGLAILANHGLSWQLEAGAIATLPGRQQTVPRGGIYAFVLALEHLDADIDYVTDHMPLLNAWQRQRWLHLGAGKNSDLWARIGRALAAKPTRRVTVSWAPSHQEDDGEPIVSNFLATGNCCADRLAYLGAVFAASGASASAPHADRWDVIASQVRRRARQALLGAAGGDPWLTERPAAEQDAIDTSAHQIVALGRGKWKCLLCRQVFASASLSEAARTPCDATAADWATFDHVRRAPPGNAVCMGTGAAHESHRLYEWPANSLFFCGTCGAYGTTLGMGLRSECKGTTTRKTAEALKRIAQGVYPSYLGPPKAIAQANSISATIAHVVSGALAPADPPQHAEEATDNSTAGQIEAVIGILHGQAIQAAQRPSRRQSEEACGLSPGRRRQQRHGPWSGRPNEAKRGPGSGHPRRQRPATQAQTQGSQVGAPTAAAGGPLGPRLWLPDYTSPASGAVVLHCNAATGAPGRHRPPAEATGTREPSPPPRSAVPPALDPRPAQPPANERTFGKRVAYLLGAARRSLAGEGPQDDAGPSPTAAPEAGNRPCLAAGQAARADGRAAGALSGAAELGLPGRSSSNRPCLAAGQGAQALSAGAAVLGLPDRSSGNRPSQAGGQAAGADGRAAGPLADAAELGLPDRSSGNRPCQASEEEDNQDPPQTSGAAAAPGAPAATLAAAAASALAVAAVAAAARDAPRDNAHG
ncbi:unnamed protein product, partial [Prorocentrum cordatum]